MPTNFRISFMGDTVCTYQATIHVRLCVDLHRRRESERQKGLVVHIYMDVKCKYECYKYTYLNDSICFREKFWLTPHR